MVTRPYEDHDLDLDPSGVVLSRQRSSIVVFLTFRPGHPDLLFFLSRPFFFFFFFFFFLAFLP